MAPRLRWGNLPPSPGVVIVGVVGTVSAVAASRWQ